MKYGVDGMVTLKCLLSNKNAYHKSKLSLIKKPVRVSHRLFYEVGIYLLLFCRLSFIKIIKVAIEDLFNTAY